MRPSVLLIVLLSVLFATVTASGSGGVIVVGTQPGSGTIIKLNSNYITSYGSSVSSKRQAGAENDTLEFQDKRQTTCIGSSHTGLQCAILSSSTTTSSCWGLTLDSGNTCITGTTAAIPSGATVSCCGVTASGCNVQLYGTVTGTAGSFGGSGNTYNNAVDGSLSTYFDGPTTNSWVGLDLHNPVAVTQMAIAARSGYESRMVGAQIQVSNRFDYSAGVYTVATLGSAPPSGSFGFFDLSLVGNFRYIRIYNAVYGNVAEFQVYGCPTTCSSALSGTVIGSGGTVSAAQDSNTGTWPSASSASGNWVGLDLGYAYRITSISYTPVSTPNNVRLNGAQVQVSNDASFSTGVFTVGSISNVGTYDTSTHTLGLVGYVGGGAFRYVRIYNAQYNNVAEFQVYGCPSINCDIWTQPSPGITAGTSGSSCLAGTTFNAMTTATVFGNCYSNTLASIGTFPAGMIEIAYISGAIRYDTSTGWTINASSNQEWSVVDSSGNPMAVAPGSSNYYSTSTDAQVGNLGANKQFSFGGGALYLKLIDTINYIDNYCESTGVPQWSFTLLP